MISSMIPGSGKDRTASVILRDVTEADLPIFYQHQTEPEANQMAAFPARQWDAFMAHWAKILTDPDIDKKTILYAGNVAGNVVGFEMSGMREVGYWIGKAFWGKGIATQALAQFLQIVCERPLFAYFANHNIASRRVLEKCGFRFFRQEGEETIFRLEDSNRGEQDS